MALGSSAALGSESQSWLDNSVRIELPRRWSVGLTQQLRTREMLYDGTYLQGWSAGIFRDVARTAWVGAFYKEQQLLNLAVDLQERRYTLELGWKRRLGARTARAAPTPAPQQPTGAPRGFAFDVRFRVESRRFEGDVEDDFIRYRLRGRVRRAVDVGRLTLEPFAYLELFSGNDEYGILAANRGGVGTAFGIGEHLSIVLSYIRQVTRDQAVIHALGSGLELSF